MLIALPMLTVLGLFLALRAREPEQTEGPGVRDDFLAATVTAAAASVVLLEGLSLVRGIRVWALAACWALAALGAWAWLVVRLRGGRRIRLALPLPTPLEGLVLLALVALVAAVGVNAIVAPPNTWDAMTYHMPRVAHWWQNGTLANYRTSEVRQLVLSPGSEMAILHFQVLGGGDRLANLPQWLAMVGSIVAASVVARQLGAPRRGQLLAAVFVATLPMGILQASGAQNDYYAAFWVICLAHYSLAIARGSASARSALLLGASLGLAILAKGSSYMYALPFCLWVAGACLWRLRLRAWKPGVLIGLSALVLLAGYYARNLQTFGSPNGLSGPAAWIGKSVRSETVSVSTTASNIVRNLALHLATRCDAHNEAVARAVAGLHERLGLDVNDPRITFRNSRFRLHRITRNDGTDGNFAHLIVAAASLPLLLWPSVRRRGQCLALYLAAVMAGFVLFCALLKWQIWHTRMHTSWFVLLGPLVGSAMSLIVRPRNEAASKPRQLLARAALLCGRLLPIALAAILLLHCYPWVVRNRRRSLLPPDSVFDRSRAWLYFTGRAGHRKHYIAAAEWLREHDVRRLGLKLGSDDYEYPVWALLGAWEGSGIRIESLAGPESWSYPLGEFQPGMILWTYRPNSPPPTRYDGAAFEEVWAGGPLRIYRRVPEEGGPATTPAPPGSPTGRT